MVEVVYRGGNMDGITSNAASEATLLKLLAKMGKGGAADNTQKLYNDAQKKGTKAINEDTKESKKATAERKLETSALKKSVNAFKNAAATLNKVSLGLGSGILNVGQTLGNLGSELISGGDNLSDFSKHVTGLISKFPIIGGLIGGPLQALIGVVDNQIDVFRRLSTVGADLGDTIFEMQILAGRMGIALDKITNTITERAVGISLAFGGISKGAREFSKMMEGVRENREAFARLGISTEEQLEYAADYLDIQRMQGMMDHRQNRNLGKATSEYILQLDRLARITGLSRKAASDAMKDVSGGALASIFAGMDKDLAASHSGLLASFNGIDKGLGDMMESLYVFDGAPVHEFAQGLELANTGMGENVRLLKENKISVAEFNDRMPGMVEKVREYIAANGDAIAKAELAGEQWPKGLRKFLAMADAMGSLEQATKEQIEEMENEKKTVAGFNQAIEDMRAKIMSALVKSGVLDMVTDQLNKFTSSIDAEGVKSISDKLVSGIKKIKEEFEELGFKGLWDKYVGAALEKAGGSIGKWIKELIFGKSEEDLTKQQDLIDKLTEQRDILKKGGAEAEAYSQKIGKDLGQVEAELAAAKTSYEEDKNKKGFLQKIMDDIFSFENIVKTLAIGGGIYVAIKGFSVLLALFGAGKVALGAAVLVGLFVGTGYAIKLAGEGINLAGEGLERVSAAMKDLSTIKDTDNLRSVAGIMGTMADSLTKFAIGGVIARMIGSDTLKNLADSISYFDTIDATKLKDVGPGIAALYEGTSKFTGDGAWEGFSKWVGSLFGGSSNDFEKMAKGIKHFETIDGMKLANLGAGLSGIAEFVAQINAETELKGQVEAIEKLIVAMKDYQEQYNDMSSDMQSNFSMAVSNSGKESVEALNQLNTVLQALLIETQTSNQIGKQIVGAVDNQGTIG